jgi:hypothetical protein
MSSVINMAPDAVRVGQQVQVCFKDAGNGEVMLPVFEPAQT